MKTITVQKYWRVQKHLKILKNTTMKKYLRVYKHLKILKNTTVQKYWRVRKYFEKYYCIRILESANKFWKILLYKNPGECRKISKNTTAQKYWRVKKNLKILKNTTVQKYWKMQKNWNFEEYYHRKVLLIEIYRWGRAK